MKVLVTGATGFIGGNLARELWRLGYEVRALVRPGSNRLTIKETGVVPMEGDILDGPSIKRAVEGCEAVFHVAAAYTFWSKDPSEIFKTNVEGTVNVLKAARDAGVSRTVYTSTVGTIGIPKNGLGTEGTPIDPKSLHGNYKEFHVACASGDVRRLRGYADSHSKSNSSGRTVGCQTYAYRENSPGLSKRECPRIPKNRNEPG